MESGQAQVGHQGQERDRCEVNWIVDTPDADPLTGQVRWDAAHSLWNGGMALAALALVPFYTTPAAVAVGLGLTGAMLLLGLRSGSIAC